MTRFWLLLLLVVLLAMLLVLLLLLSLLWLLPLLLLTRFLGPLRLERPLTAGKLSPVTPGLELPLSEGAGQFLS